METHGLWSQILTPSKTFIFETPEDVSIQLSSASYGPSISTSKDAKNERSVVTLKYLHKEPEEEDMLGSDSGDEDEEELELEKKVNGKKGKNSDAMDEDADADSDFEGERKEEEREAWIAHLVPGRVEHQLLTLVLPAGDRFEFSVSGTHPVCLMGAYVTPIRPEGDFPPTGGYDSGEENEYEYDGDSEEWDEDEEDEEVEERFKELLEGEDEGENKKEEKKAKVDKVKVVEKKEKKDEKEQASPAPKPTESKKRPHPESEDEADKSKVSETAGGVSVDNLDSLPKLPNGEIDMNKLSKNQRKKLNKKLKGEDGKSVPTGDAGGENGKKEEKKEKKEKGGDEKMVTLGNGLKYIDKRVGDGKEVEKNKKLSMRYIGKFQDGKVFDSNTKGAPFKFVWGKGQVIQGWEQGLKGMKVGGERHLVVPPALGYGKKGTNGIPGNSTLLFDIKLLEVN